MHLFLDIPNVIVANNKANLHILQFILVHPVGTGKKFEQFSQYKCEIMLIQYSSQTYTNL